MRHSDSALPDAYSTAMSELRLETHGSLVTLFIDGVESSAVDLSDPHHLEFEYMQHIRIAINARWDPPEPLRILHLGAAGCALAKALDADRPGSRQLAIEIDPELATIVRDWFDLPSSPQLRIRAEDARRTLDTNKGSWHVIVRDAFRDGRVPNQLATFEAHSRAYDRLTDDGLYCLNIAGEAGLTQVYREFNVLDQLFNSVAAIADPAIVKGRRFGNVILIASHSTLPHAEIDRLVRKLPLPTVVVGAEQLRAGAKTTSVLTDNMVGWPSEH